MGAVDTASSYAKDLHGLLDRIGPGIDALAGLVTDPAASSAPAITAAALPNDRAIYDCVRQLLGGKLATAAFEQLKAAIILAQSPPQPGVAVLGLADSDFISAAGRLKCSVAQIRAVDEVESAGGGLEQGRADILALDGPGGFIDGRLSKILFEALKFHRHTDGKYDASHPNISSPKWDRSLYKGGQAEWGRLYEAMRLDRTAALLSTSWGRYQILGENYKVAGFTSVDAFVTAMQSGEPAHLEAFIMFVLNSKLDDELRAISVDPKTCAAFAAGYNGPAYAANQYDVKLANAFKKWSA